MRKTTASLLVLCGVVAAGAVPTLYGCGGGAKPAATPTESSDTAALPEPAVIASASAAPADSSANDAPSPLAQVLTTDSGQIQKIFQAAMGAPAATLKQNGAT
ncbi:MAG: hypothetical protein ABSE49_24725, partial [Polyangiaceae bacterium]